MDGLASASDTAIALYIHLPWCVQRCPYCDFNAHTQPDVLPETSYVQALSDDLKAMQQRFGNKPIKSIFFGGGTPSLFSGKSIAKILQHVDETLSIPKNCEITLEANPGTLDNQRLLSFYQAGVNRLSVGVQSFNNKHLKALGRIHSFQQALDAIKIAQNIPFKAINLDLMFGLPGQNYSEAMQDLSMAIQLNPAHISWYELTIEPNTYFAKHPPQRVESNIRADWMASGRDLLASAHYQHYEVSAFAQPNQQCQHNRWVWSFGDYWGIGAGAHSKQKTPAASVRCVKQRHPLKYLKMPTKLQDHHHINQADLPFEYLLNRLRLLSPIPWQQARAFAGLTAEHPAIQSAIQSGWLVSHLENFQLTESGQWFIDEILSLFLN